MMPMIQSLRDRLRQRPLVVGHRGAMGYYPENTMVSFQRALELGADLVEFDVHLSRDGVAVVIHDETLERTTQGRGFVGEHTLDQLRTLDAGIHKGTEFAGAQIPTLDEILLWARNAETFVDIEIKSGPVVYPGIEQVLVDSLQRFDMVLSAIVISFDHQAVRRIKLFDSRIATGVLYAARLVDPVAVARVALADTLLPHWAYVREEDVRAAHDAGIFVAPWFTSDPDVARTLFRFGVDGIGSNHPDIIRNVAEEFRRT